MKKLKLVFTICLFFATIAWTQENQFSLNQLIDHAVENNYLLQASEKASTIKLHEIDVLKTEYLPQITLNASASYWKFLMPNKQRLLGNTLSDVYTDITIQQPIYSWGVQDIRKDLVEDEVMLNTELQRQIKSTIIWGVSDTYFEILKAASEIEVHENALEQLNGHLQFAESLYNIGRVTGIDLLKINVQISVEEKALQKAQNAWLAEIIRLKRLCNFEDGAEVSIRENSDSLFHVFSLKEFLPNLFYQDAFNNHPALQSVEIELQMEARQNELTRLENRPELFSYGIASWNDGYFPFGNNFNYNFGVGLRYTIPYWGGSAFRTRMLQSDLRFEKLSVEKNQAFLEIKSEIDLAINQLDDLKMEISNNEKIIKLAEETIANSLVKYQSGQGNIIDLLDAQTILTEASISYQKSTTSFLQALAKLHYLTGSDEKPF